MYHISCKLQIKWKGPHGGWIECFWTKYLSSWFCTDRNFAHINPSTFSGHFDHSLHVCSKKKMPWKWGRSHFWGTTWRTYTTTLLEYISSTTYDIIACSTIMNDIWARFGISYRNGPGTRTPLVSGQFGLHVMATKRSGCPVLFEIATISCIVRQIYRSSPTCVDARINSLPACTMLASCSILPEPSINSRNLLYSDSRSCPWFSQGWTNFLLLANWNDLPRTVSLDCLIAKENGARRRAVTNSVNRTW